jgi:hypothetical protein
MRLLRRFTPRNASLKHTRRPTLSGTLAWRRLYGEKTVRKAERAWFLSAGEKSEALIRVAFDSLGQKQRVFEPYCLSLSSMVAADISQNLGLNNQLYITELEILS